MAMSILTMLYIMELKLWGLLYGLLMTCTLESVEWWLLYNTFTLLVFVEYETSGIYSFILYNNLGFMSKQYVIFHEFLYY